MEYTVNGIKHEITTVVHSKQCKEYYDALKEDDAAAAHLLYIPPWHKPWYMIEHEMRMIELRTTYESEIEHIENTPPELLGCGTI